MTSRRMFISTVLTLAAVPALVTAQTCCPAKKEEKKACDAASSKLKAAGATVVSCDGAKTKIKVKCGKCGFLAAETEIATPTADKPYTLEWKCPKCGNKQTVKVEAPAACAAQ